MKSRNVILLVVFGMLLIIGALCVVTGIGTFAWLRERNVNDLSILISRNVLAEAVEEKTLIPRGRLEVENGAGAVTITAEDGLESIELKLHKKAWGENEADAQQRLEAITVSVEESGDKIRLVYQPPETIGNQEKLDSVDFEIRVPVDMAVDVNTRFGGIELTGTMGSAHLAVRFGDVYAADIMGAVTVDAEFGRLELKNIQAGGEDITAETRFGALSVENLAGRDIRLRTENGVTDSVGVNTARELTIESQFGGISLENFRAGSLKVANRNGNIDIVDGTISGPLTLNTSFASITLEAVSAESYTVEGRNGDIRLDNIQGNIRVTNRFGQIVINQAEDAVLDIENANGEIYFSGSLDNTVDHRVTTSFGSIGLSIPADSALDLDLQTRFGDIDSEMPVTMTGSLSNTHWQAQLNGGGGLLTVENQNGNISLNVLRGEQ